MRTIGERIKYLRNKNNVTMKALSEATNISKGNLSSYENNKFKPSADAIILISQFFKISTDWILIGESKDMHIDNHGDNSQKDNVEGLSDEEKKIVMLFRELSDRDKIKIEGMLEMKAAESKTFKKGMSSNYQSGEEAATKERKHA